MSKKIITYNVNCGLPLILGHKGEHNNKIIKFVGMTNVIGENSSLYFYLRYQNKPIGKIVLADGAFELIKEFTDISTRVGLSGQVKEHVLNEDGTVECIRDCSDVFKVEVRGSIDVPDELEITDDKVSLWGAKLELKYNESVALINEIHAMLERGDFTPKKYIDYWTEADRNEVRAEYKVIVDEDVARYVQETNAKKNLDLEEYDDYAEGIEEEFNQNASEKTNAFNQNATNKAAAYDANANAKLDAYNSNATSQTNAFNTNAISKQNAFNSNANEVTEASKKEIEDKANDELEKIHTDEVVQTVSQLNEDLSCLEFRTDSIIMGLENTNIPYHLGDRGSSSGSSVNRTSGTNTMSSDLFDAQNFYTIMNLRADKYKIVVRSYSDNEENNGTFISGGSELYDIYGNDTNVNGTGGYYNASPRLELMLGGYIAFVKAKTEATKYLSVIVKRISGTSGFTTDEQEDISNNIIVYKGLPTFDKGLLPHIDRFYKKKAILFGDSICYGKVGRDIRTENRIDVLLGERLGIKCDNVASSGSKMTKKASDTDSVCTLVDNYNFANYDYAIVFCGTNDYGQSRAIGTITENPSNADGVRFYPAYRYVIEKMLTDNPKLNIMLVTPTFRNYVTDATKEGGYAFGNTYTTVPNSLNNTLGKYCDAIVNVGDYYNVPVVDLRKNSPINQFNYANMLYHDGGNKYLHPLDETYKLMNNKIVSAFESNM